MTTASEAFAAARKPAHAYVGLSLTALDRARALVMTPASIKASATRTVDLYDGFARRGDVFAEALLTRLFGDKAPTLRATTKPAPDTLGARRRAKAH